MTLGMKSIGTYLIAGLYFLLGVGLSFFIPAVGEIFAYFYVDPPGQDIPPLMVPFFWPAYVWTLFFGVCAFLLCLTARLPPKTRKRVNIGAWLVFFILVLLIPNWVYGFTFCNQKIV